MSESLSISTSNSSCFHTHFFLYLWSLQSLSGLRWALPGQVLSPPSVDSPRSAIPEISGLILPGPWKYMDDWTEITHYSLSYRKPNKNKVRYLPLRVVPTYSFTIPGTLNVCRNYPERKQEGAQGYRDFCSDRTEMKRGCLLRMRLTLIFVENELNDHNAVFHLLWWFSSPYLLTATREF